MTQASAVVNRQFTPTFRSFRSLTHAVTTCPSQAADPIRQCLDRRIPDRDTLAREVAAWETKRNAAGVTADWPFTTADARVKLRRLYPAPQKC